MTSARNFIPIAQVLRRFTLRLALAFWNHQVEAELRERGWEEYLFASSSSREECMKKIDEERANSVYPHDESDCSEECKQRGKLYTISIIRT